jgi:3',5'-cyclic AMP phosphodiesterase CpdA
MRLMNKRFHFKRKQKIGLYIIAFLVAAGLGWGAIRWYVNQESDARPTSASDRSFLLSLDEGDMVKGSKVILGTAAEQGMKLNLLIDGTKVPAKSVMEQPALITMEVEGVNGGDGFKNSVWVNGKQVHVFETNLDAFTRISIPVPASFLQTGSNSVTFRAGNKVSPEDLSGEHDSWKFRAFKFELGDGTVLDDPDYKTATIYTVGSTSPPTAQSPAELQKAFHFTLKEEKYRTVYYEWDTGQVPEGSHKVELRAATGSGQRTKVVHVKVDNTPPLLEIVSPVEGRTYKNKVAVKVQSSDAASGDPSVVAKLDGKVIELPQELETTQLAVGNHKLTVTTADKAGNERSSEVTFRVLDEMPVVPSEPSPAHRATVTAGGQIHLSVQASDSANDPLTVSFYKGRRYDFSDPGKYEAYSNAVDREPPLQKVPEGEKVLLPQEKELIAARDGRYLVNDAKDRFPYHRFSFEVDETLLADAEVVWTGHSLPDRLVTLYVWNQVKQKWEDLDSNKGTEDFTLRGKLGLEQVKDSLVEVLVQDRIPSPSDYDFAFLWMTDTQYYSESFPRIYDLMTKWTVDHWKEKKFNYMIHTGDIVNNWNSKVEWENASRSMKTLDDAHIPYGVVAGNHDVAYDVGNYEEFWKYFGKERYVGQPTFGDDLNNNRDHYDLVSVQGNDFVIVYLGWLIDQKSFDWANSILKKYADRNAIIATHEYLKPNKAYFGQGKAIWDKLVVPNPNVFMVLGGHNPGVANNVRTIGDRTVLEMLSDYQNGPEGGQGFMRFLQFDLEGHRLLVNTYSPYLRKWNFFKPEEDDLVLPLKLKPIEKQVATDYIGINARTHETIGKAGKVASGSRATIPYPGIQPGQSYSWYAVARDEFGGQSKSEVWTFTTN